MRVKKSLNLCHLTLRNETLNMSLLFQSKEVLLLLNVYHQREPLAPLFTPFVYALQALTGIDSVPPEETTGWAQSAPIPIIVSRIKDIINKIRNSVRMAPSEHRVNRELRFLFESYGDSPFEQTDITPIVNAGGPVVQAPIDPNRINNSPVTESDGSGQEEDKYQQIGGESD